MDYSGGSELTELKSTIQLVDQISPTAYGGDLNDFLSLYLQMAIPCE